MPFFSGHPLRTERQMPPIRTYGRYIFVVKLRLRYRLFLSYAFYLFASGFRAIYGPVILYRTFVQPGPQMLWNTELYFREESLTWNIERP